MEKFEKMFRKVTDDRIGLKVTTHYYQNNSLSYFHKIEIIDDNRIKLVFERSYTQTYFDSKKERDQFIEFFKNKVREANTFGKNKH